ncbi:uncharacterized protein LOC133899890 [Phragmites australis]|uniref:uncharacterized protein LOC133899890 n=1 Tax=Phragmites australis TaxID=29695 RepID=UPI002D795A7D|nr:uncharacterized protein LOC133899890 [Phragmites australis]
MSSCRRRPDWVLLNIHAVAGFHSNGTTARDSTRNGKTIEVSLCPALPPHPSNLFVHSSDMNVCVPPVIVCTVDDLLLLRVNMGCGPFSLSPVDCDYFIYRAHASRPSLERLQRPHPFFQNSDVGLLPRPDGHYTVAALIAIGPVHQYVLHLFHSKISSWSCSTLSVKAPQREFPVKIPSHSGRLHHHLTTTVITIGGEGGTMGWVDLWRGILFCDVLDNKPSLRGVSLPLPLKEMSYNNGMGMKLGAAGQRRGIAFIRDKGCLKFVHLEISDVRLPGYDDETGAPSFRTDDWAVTTWTNTKMTDSFEDWHQDYMVQASDITIDNPAISEVLESGLLRKPRGNGAAAEELALQNLSMYQPAPCVNGKDVVYLVAREKFMHPKAWILAVDMENSELQAVVEFGAQIHLGATVIYCPSSISKYTNPAKYINPSTTPVEKGPAGLNDQDSAAE